MLSGEKIPVIVGGGLHQDDVAERTYGADGVEVQRLLQLPSGLIAGGICREVITAAVLVDHVQVRGR